MKESDLISIKDLNVDYRVRQISESASWVTMLFSSSYKNHPVFSGLHWVVGNQPGVTALLGRNGAGKTTLIKVLTGILTPQSGEIKVMGFTPAERKKEFLRRIGVVFGQKRILWPELSVLENLKLTGSLYSLDRRKARMRIDELISCFGLDALVDRPQKALSLGESMKSEIVNALLPEPHLLFLDEPTVGLDLQSQVSVRNMLKAYSRLKNCHIILTSHNMKDVTELADSIYFVEGSAMKYFEKESGHVSVHDLEDRMLSRCIS